MKRIAALLALACAVLVGFMPVPDVQFRDVTAKAGIKALIISGGARKNYVLEVNGSGACWFDYNNDGYMDLYLVNGSTLEELQGKKPASAHRSYLYRNNKNGTFTDVTETAHVPGTGWGFGCVAADYDNDGNSDLFITNFGRNVLYHNNGDGTFTDVTAKSGLEGGNIWHTGAAFGDYDGDGLIDVYVAGYMDFNIQKPELKTCEYRGVQVHACGPLGYKGAPDVLYHNNGDGTFTDVTEKAGVTDRNLYFGFAVIFDDLDGDGNLDILISGIGFQDPLRLFHNNADGTFTERSKEAGLGSEMGGLNIVQADYNNDGHTDVFVLRGGWMGKAGVFPSSLLRNNGDGTFTDVTKEAGLLRFGPTQTAVWLDYNNDGLLDLFVAYESSGGVSHPCALFRNNGNGTFTDVAEQAGVNFTGYVKAVVSADYDNDGLPDLYLTIGGHEGGDNILFHNNGDGTFSNFAAKAGVTEPHHSFSAFFFDYDNDGWPDLFVIGYQVESVADVAADYLGKPTKAERPRLYHNNRNGTFTDVTKAMHLDKVILGMGIGYGDLDNDGYLDFYVGTGNPDLAMIIPKRMFRNDEGKRFQEVTTAGDFGHLQKGHAIAFADINNDGNQDIFEQLGGANFGDIAYSALYANPGNSNHWITLKLEGVQTNRSAIGARIKVTVKTASGPRDIYKTVSSGGSFGAGPLRQGIGLGKAVEIDHVEIYWPVSRRTQSLRGLAMDKPYQVREDKDQATPLALKTFAWPTTKAPAK